MILLKHFPGQNQAKIPHDHQVVKRALLHRFMSKRHFYMYEPNCQYLIDLNSFWYMSHFLDSIKCS